MNKEISISKKTETSTAIIEMLSENLVTIKFKPYHVSKEQSEENMRIVKQMAGNKKIGLISDIRQLKGIDQNARVAGALIAKDCVKMNAIIVDSLFINIIAKLYLVLKKPIYPVHLFESESQALNWLKTK